MNLLPFTSTKRTTILHESTEVWHWILWMCILCCFSKFQSCFYLGKFSQHGDFLCENFFGKSCFSMQFWLKTVGFAQNFPIIWSQNIEKKIPAHNIWRFNITWVPMWYTWVGCRGKSWLWVNHYHSDHIGAFRVKRLLGLDPTAGKIQTCCPFCSNKRLLDPNFKCRKLVRQCQARCTFNGKGALKRKQNLVGTVKRTNVWTFGVFVVVYRELHGYMVWVCLLVWKSIPIWYHLRQYQPLHQTGRDLR
jgi:hypothetical protein